MDHSSSPNTILQHFNSVPWIAALLAQPGIKTFTPAARMDLNASHPGHIASQDQLFRKTFNSNDTVPFYMAFYRDPISESGIQVETKPNDTSSHVAAKTLLLTSTSLLCDIRLGINGFNNSAHGGFIASLIDEVSGTLLVINLMLQQKAESYRPSRFPPDAVDLKNVPYWTAGMTVRLKRPIETPQIILATASLSRVEGTKLIFDVTLEGENGVVFTSGEVVWISKGKGKL